MEQIKVISNKAELPGFFIEKTAKKMKQSFAKILIEIGADITVDQWIILQHLYKEGPMNQFEIAERAFKDRPTVTRIIDLLCNKNLIERKVDINDRRRMLIILTETGMKEVQAIIPKVKSFRLRAYRGLTDHDIGQLKIILDEILSNLSDKNH